MLSQRGKTLKLSGEVAASGITSGIQTKSKSTSKSTTTGTHHLTTVSDLTSSPFFKNLLWQDLLSLLSIDRLRSPLTSFSSLLYLPSDSSDTYTLCEYKLSQPQIGCKNYTRGFNPARCDQAFRNERVDHGPRVEYFLKERLNHLPPVPSAWNIARIEYPRSDRLQIPLPVGL